MKATKEVGIEMAAIDLRAHLRNVERSYYRDYLAATDGNKTLASELLGMHRPTLVARLKSLGMLEWIQTRKDKLGGGAE